MTIEEAARRRDFAVNAISWDPLTGAILRSVATVARDLDRQEFSRRSLPTTFGDDSLRVLRAVQFAARFELTARRRDEGAVPIDPPRRPAARADLGRDRRSCCSGPSARHIGFALRRWSWAWSISSFQS